MLKKYGLSFLLLVCMLAPAQSTVPAEHWIAVRAGRLFDGTEKFAPNQVILIKGARIVKVGPAERVQVATRGIQTTGGFILRGYSTDIPLPSPLQAVDSPWAAREAVRDQVAHDADLIKLYAAYDFHFTSDGKMVVPPTFTAEEVNAIVDEAHKKGRKVSCHAFGGEGLRNCLNAGVESLEHGVDLEDSDIKLMVQKGIYLVPTLY